MFKDDVKILHMETSSVCNAACPMCPREYDIRFDKKKDPTSLSLAQVKDLFSIKFIQNLELMFMCGNYGDPAAAPECIDIFNYFRKVNPTMKLGIHSNGGLRSETWWKELGNVLSRDGDYCVFSIDGLADTNHIYRINTDFNKIMSNAKSFIDAGGKARWEYLVFAHNQHQVEEAKQLAKELGFERFNEKVSRRFNLNIGNFKPPMEIKND